MQIDKKKLRDIIAALRRCEAGPEACENCPYDGICSTRSFALTRDAAEFLEMLLAAADDMLQ